MSSPTPDHVLRVDLDATRQLVADLRDDLADYDDGAELVVGREWATALVAAVLGDIPAPARE
jgi:hypothetical protein